MFFCSQQLPNSNKVNVKSQKNKTHKLNAIA